MMDELDMRPMTVRALFDNLSHEHPRIEPGVAPERASAWLRKLADAYDRGEIGGFAISVLCEDGLARGKTALNQVGEPHPVSRMHAANLRNGLRAAIHTLTAVEEHLP